MSRRLCDGQLELPPRAASIHQHQGQRAGAPYRMCPAGHPRWPSGLEFSGACTTWLVLQCSSHTDETLSIVGGHQQTDLPGPTRSTLTPTSGLSYSLTSARLRWQMAVCLARLLPGVRGMEKKETISVYPVFFSIVWWETFAINLYTY